MRLLVVSTNQLRPSADLPWEPVPPLGAAYIVAAVRAHGHDASLVDLCFSRDWRSELAGAIERGRPGVIGISFRNIETTAYFRNTSFLGDLQEVVELCRERSRARIVLGGSGFSVMPAEILRLTGCSYGIAGEGEWSFPELLDAWSRGDDHVRVPGLVSVHGGASEIVPPDRRHSLAAIVRPDRLFVRLRDYVGAGGSANVQSKRGCRFGCVYCSYPVIEGAAVRCRPAGEVVDELRELAEGFGISSAYIVDSQFNDPPGHAKEICEELARERDAFKIWWSAMVNPAGMDDELALLMKLSRCAFIDLGIDSASDTMLSHLRKGFTRGDIGSTIDLLRKNKIRFNTWIALGGPGETERTILETLDFLVERGVPSALFTIGLRIYPATALERIAREEGRLGESDDLLNPVFYLSMEAERIASIVEPYLRGRKGWRIAARRHPDD